MKRVAALYDDPEDGRRAVAALEDSGMPPERISFLARAPENDGAAVDAIDTGAVIGAGGGALAGLAIAVLPGIGSVAVAGAVAFALAGAALGGAVGGLVGRFVEQEFTEEDAETFAEGLRRGGALVTAEAEEAQVNAVNTILWHAGAVDLEARRASYRDRGWDGFDERDTAWGTDEIERERDDHGDVAPPILMPVPPVR